MKHLYPFYVIISFILIAQSVIASETSCNPNKIEYRPFVEDGKHWIVVYSTNKIYWIKDYYIAEDTIIANQSCKKLMCHYTNYEDNINDTMLYAVIFENNKRIFYYPPKAESSIEPIMLYDFSVTHGDVVSLGGNSQNLYQQDSYLIQDTLILANNNDCFSGIQAILNNGSYTIIDGDTVYTEFQWYEGIGSIFDPFEKFAWNKYMGGPPHHLYECRVNDEIIYSNTMGLDLPTDVVYFPESMEWKIKVEELCEDKLDYTLQSIRMGKDTVISDLSYTMIDNIPVREKDGKIYCYIQDWNGNYVEYKLYDFNLEVGDSIRKTFYNQDAVSSLYAKVIKVDTIQLLDGRFAKRFQYDDRPTDVEYIGNIERGFFAPLDCIVIPCIKEQFVCCSINNEPIYEAVEGGCKDITIGYHTYFSNHAQWYIEDIGWEKCYEIYRHEYFIGDSIIDGKTYQILNGKVPLMSVKNKIYANISGKDLLLYDFDLQIGDSLPVYDSGEVLWHFNSSEPWIDEVRVHYYAHVKSIDTLVLANGVKARVLYYAGREPDIEYVGNARGILAPLFYAEIPTCAGVVSMCFSDENGIIYENNGLCERLDDKFGKAFPQGSKWETIGDWGILTDAESGFGFSSCVVESAGDTVINDRQYQMFSTSKTRADGAIEDSVLLFVRSEDERWYGWSSDCPAKEYLLADFSMHVGDSLVIPYYFSDKPTNIPFHVTDVDTVTLNDGRKAKRLSFDGGKPAIIEHVGSEGGLYALFGTLSAPSRIITSCYSVNDEIIYSDVIDKPLFLQYYDTLHSYYCSEYRGEYHPLLTNDKTWSYFYNRVNEPDSYKEILSTRTFSIKGDTTVWNRDYKIIASDWEDHITWIFREDINKQKVYARVLADAYCGCDNCYYCNGKEYLLYDFSAKRGDTVEVLVGGFAYEGTLKYVVKDVFYETIQPSGESRKHIHLDPVKVESPYYLDEILNRSITWIEGVGNTYYEFIPMNLEPTGYGRLMCMSKGDEVMYSTELGNKYECYVDTVIDHTALDMIDGVDLRLVIKDGMLRVESNDGINHIAIYDPQGKQLLQSPHSSVDISTLSSGLYLVVIKTNKSIWSDKFVVK